jgi:hypothetical protein
VTRTLPSKQLITDTMVLTIQRGWDDDGTLVEALIIQVVDGAVVRHTLRQEYSFPIVMQEKVEVVLTELPGHRGNQLNIPR